MMEDISADASAYLKWDPKFRNLVSFVHGQEATVTDHNGIQSSGIIAALAPDCSVILSEAATADSEQYVPYTSQALEAVTLKDTSITDLITNYCSDTNAESGVSSNRLMNGSTGKRSDKPLEPFNFDQDNDSDLEYGLDDNVKSWDYNEMISANESRGVVTTYNEDDSQYTNVEVPELTAEQRQAAERHARDIMQSSGYRTRIELENKETDEETAFSAVLRKPPVAAGNKQEKEENVNKPGTSADTSSPTTLKTRDSRSSSLQPESSQQKTPTNEAEGGAQKTPTVTRTTAPSRESSSNETIGILQTPLPSSSVASLKSSPGDVNSQAADDSDKSPVALNPNAEVFRPRTNRPSQTPTPQTSRNPTPPRPGSAASRGSSVGPQQVVMLQPPPMTGYVQPLTVLPQVYNNPHLPKRAVVSAGRQNTPLSLIGSPMIAAPSNPLVVLNQAGVMHSLQQQSVWPYSPVSRLVGPGGNFPGTVLPNEHAQNPSMVAAAALSHPVLLSALQQQSSGGQPPSAPPTPGTPQSFAASPTGHPLVALTPHHAVQPGHSAQQPGLQGSHNQQQPQYMLMGAGPQQHQYAAQIAAAVNQASNGSAPMIPPPQGPPPVQAPQPPTPHQPGPPHAPPHGPPPHVTGPLHGPPPGQVPMTAGPPHSQHHYPQDYPSL